MRITFLLNFFLQTVSSLLLTFFKSASFLYKTFDVVLVIFIFKI